MTPLMIIDTHAHIYHQGDFYGPNCSFVPAISFKDYLNNKEQSAQSLKSSSNHLLGIGIHPMNAQALVDIPLIKAELENACDTVAFIGEIGLDKRYLENIPYSLQQAVFKEMLSLAKEYQKVVNIHCVRMHNELLGILKEFYKPLNHAFFNRSIKKTYNGIIHSFSGSQEIAEEYLKLGFKLGIGSAILHLDAHKLRNLVAKLDLSYLVLETDYPYFYLNLKEVGELFTAIGLKSNFLGELGAKASQTSQNLEKVIFSGEYLILVAELISFLKGQSVTDTIRALNASSIALVTNSSYHEVKLL